jgi:Family of unknown function (DUF6169)
MKYIVFGRSDEINTFYFETDYASDYLFPTLSIEAGSVFEFVLSVAESTRTNSAPPDSRIAPTVVAAITDFLKADANRVITYICDSSDRRELARKRKFDQWFDMFATNDFRKQEGTLTDFDGISFYIAAIWLQNHSLTDQIAAAFNDLSDQYNADKPA